MVLTGLVVTCMDCGLHICISLRLKSDPVINLQCKLLHFLPLQINLWLCIPWLFVYSKHKFECIAALQTRNRNLLVMTPGVWKMILIKLKKPISAAAEEGWTSNISLKALAQLGRSTSCDFHHAIGSVWMNTSSAAAKYVGRQSIMCKKWNARSESISVAVGLRSFSLDGEK